MRNILDKLFENKKLSIIIPWCVSVAAYLLYAVLGKAEGKNEILLITPIVAVFWFFGCFLVVFVQVKNPSCPEWFLNFFELAATLFFESISIVFTLIFIFSGFQNFSPFFCAGLVTYASVAWAHNKRN